MFGEIRVVINEKSEPMFCGIDVAKALGYKEPKQAITTYCKSGST